MAVASKADATQQQKALNTQISKDYLVKQQDDLIKLMQSLGCDAACQRLTQYSINQLTPVIDNYDELQRSNNFLSVSKNTELVGGLIGNGTADTVAGASARAVAWAASSWATWRAGCWWVSCCDS
ncbi:hypothetical protein VW41_23160 [Klebsiella michiganensis]|nr:hypothetical protein VW41_23160 [Klebsiella michiganensis]